MGISQEAKVTFARENRLFGDLSTLDVTGNGALARLYRLTILEELTLFSSKGGLPTEMYSSAQQVKVIMQREHKLERVHNPRITRGQNDTHFDFGGVKDGATGMPIIARRYIELLAESIRKGKFEEKQLEFIFTAAKLIEDELEASYQAA